LPLYSLKLNLPPHSLERLTDTFPKQKYRTCPFNKEKMIYYDQNYYDYFFQKIPFFKGVAENTYPFLVADILLSVFQIPSGSSLTCMQKVKLVKRHIYPL